MVLVGAGVLQHHIAHLVIGIDQGKGPLGQGVKEHLLGGDVVVHRLVEVHVVTRQVGEDAAAEGQTADALLADAVTADFHEGVGTTLVGHTTQQAVQQSANNINGNNLLSLLLGAMQ